MNIMRIKEGIPFYNGIYGSLAALKHYIFGRDINTVFNEIIIIESIIFHIIIITA